MNTIFINGQKFEVTGNNVHVQNGIITVDGVTIVSNLSGVVEVKWDGDLANLKCSSSVACNDVIGNVDAGGSVNISGDVAGDVDAGGSVNVAGNVNGSIDAGGSVHCNKL